MFTLCSCPLIYRALYGCLLATCSECEDHFGKISVAENVLHRDWGIETMQTVGKIAGLLLGFIALYLSATGFLAVAPDTDKTEAPSTPYEIIFTHAESMALALTNEVVPTVTAYGIDGPAPASFSKSIAAARTANAAAFEALQELAADNAVSLALIKQFSELQIQADKLGAMRPEIDADLNSEPGAIKNLSSRRVLRAFAAMLDTLLTIERLTLFTAPAADSASTAALHMRHNLLVMLSYSGREAAMLGEHVASERPISGVTKDIGSQLGGRISIAWHTVRSIGISGLFDQSIGSALDGLDTTETVFLEEFSDSKFELYDLSEGAMYDAPENEDDITVDYSLSPESWVEIYSTAAAPALELLAAAKAFKPVVEVLNAEPIDAQIMHASLFLGSLLLTLLFVVSLFLPAKHPQTAMASTPPRGAAGTHTNVP